VTADEARAKDSSFLETSPSDAPTYDVDDSIEARIDRA
jgi:hypothetical protein